MSSKKCQFSDWNKSGWDARLSSNKKSTSGDRDVSVTQLYVILSLSLEQEMVR